MLLGGFVLLPAVLTSKGRARLARAWARGVLAALGVRLSARGGLPARRGLLVANHVSWLDVIALLAVAPHAVLLAKHEVRCWPVIGTLARAAGTLFVDRARPSVLPGLVDVIARTLREGSAVVGFPEGTTWCGLAAGRFRPALFQAAIDAGVPVVPVALSYQVDGAPTTVTAFVGGETLWTSVWRIAGVRRLSVRVQVTAALHPASGADRRALARAAESAVHAALPLLRLPARPPAVDLAVVQDD